MKTLEASPEVQKELLINECKEEWVIWSPLKRRVERTEGLDAKLNSEYKMSYDIMDNLLQKVFDITVELEEVQHEQQAA